MVMKKSPMCEAVDVLYSFVSDYSGTCKQGERLECPVESEEALGVNRNCMPVVSIHVRLLATDRHERPAWRCSA